jgi:hypothetical protein
MDLETNILILSCLGKTFDFEYDIPTLCLHLGILVLDITPDHQLDDVVH